MTNKKYTDLFCDFDDTLYDTRGNAILSLAELYDFFHLADHFDDPRSEEHTSELQSQR